MEDFLNEILVPGPVAEASDPLLLVVKPEKEEEEVIPEGFVRHILSGKIIPKPLKDKRGRFIKRKMPKAAKSPAAATRATPPAPKPKNRVEEKEEEETPYDFPDLFSQPIRMVDLNVMAKRLWCDECCNALSLRDYVEDEHNLFKSVLKIKCYGCDQVKSVALSLLSTDGNCSAYQKTTFTRGSSLNYNVLKEVCLEVGRQVAGVSQIGMKRRGAENANEEVHSLNRQDRRRKKIKTDEVKTVKKSTPAVKKKSQKSSSKVVTKEIKVERMEVEESCEPSPSVALESPSAEENVSVTYDDPTAWDSTASSDEDYVPPDLFQRLCEPVKTRKDGPPIDWSALKPEPSSSNCEKCLYCDEEFPFFRKATLHMAKEHPDFNNLKCGVCQIQSPNMKAFKRHITHHRPNFTNLCTYCGKMCFTKRLLEFHLLTHMPEEEASFPCPKCPKILKSQNQRQKHLSSIHAPDMTCDFCSKKLRQRHRFIYHIKMHLENKTYDCEICGAHFLHKDNRNTHMRNNHNWICLVCGGKFSLMETVRDHCETEHSKEQIEASQINGVAYEKVTKFQCCLCYRYLASKQSLEFHLNTHTGEGKKRPPTGGSRKKNMNND